MPAGSMATNVPHQMVGIDRMPTKQGSSGRLSRWLRVESAILSSRYRYSENSEGIATGNGAQHREAFKGNFNFDSSGRYQVVAGVFAGNGITRGWSNTGWGSGSGQTNVFLKQLYFSGRPVSGLHLEYGGLYVLHGESTEITSYDYHVYLVGQRISLQRPTRFFLDEISITYAYLGDFDQPNLLKRFDRLKKSNYHQYLVSKKLGRQMVVSADYTSAAGSKIFRQAFKTRLPARVPVDSLHFENYQRTGCRPGYGIGAYLEKLLLKRLKIGGGYASIDRNYGSLNSDHFSIGKRLYATANLGISPGFGIAVFVTRSVANDHPLPVRTRLDLVLSYNLLGLVNRAGLF
ncbi:MAG: hypothetical protein AB1898_26785 [Acidobacteriota bacterium]